MTTQIPWPIGENLTLDQLLSFLDNWQRTKCPGFQLMSKNYDKTNRPDDPDLVSLEADDIRTLIADLRVFQEAHLQEDFHGWGPFQVWALGTGGFYEPVREVKAVDWGISDDAPFFIRLAYVHLNTQLETLVKMDHQLDDIARACRADSCHELASYVDEAGHDLDHLEEHLRKVRRGMEMTWPA